MASAETMHDVAPVAAPKVSHDAEAFFLGGLLAASLLGTCLLLTIHGVHAVKLYRWLGRAAVENPLLAETCAEVAASLGVRGPLRSCVVDARTTPLLWAWRGPLVVVPRQFLDDLSPQQLRSVVAHELAHLRRRDHWANLFVFLVKGLLWWNPVVWWADRELRTAQELCCDAMAIDCCKATRRSYATTLLKALDFIQAEPLAPRALAAGMGSKTAILRRFEMIAETRLSYQLSRGTFFMLLLLAIPLVCMPVRGQEKGPADAGGKKEAAAKPVPAKPAAETPLDPKTKALGEAAYKRLTTWSDSATLVLKNGQTARMKVKKNITPVAEIQITPHFVEHGTVFDLEGVDAAAKTIEGSKCTSMVIHGPEGVNMGLGKGFVVNGESILAKIHLSPTRLDQNTVRVLVKALFTPLGTPEETKAMLLTQGKSGQMHLNFQAISRWVSEYRWQEGHYPKTLKELKRALPKDVYSPTGEDYHYEAQENRFLLSSCGKDGIYGNADDEFLICRRNGSTSGQRHELYPLDEDKDVQTKSARKEMVIGARPQGDCSIDGKLVSAASGKPIAGVSMYLHYNVTHGSIFVNTASDGTFVFKDIPQGPFSLVTSYSPGYQPARYDPEEKHGLFPPVTLKKGEHRTGIVLKAEDAYRISGRILDESGQPLESVGRLTVLGWVEFVPGHYRTAHGFAKPDGSYWIDGLDGKPVYVMAINWRAARLGEASPPVYYPGTFSRDEAKKITFEKGQKKVDNIDILLKKHGGLVLEGTVRDESGKPVPEAFVAAHHQDMSFDFVTAYTDQQGHYRIEGLGPGELLVHVDAVHRGLVRKRTPIDLDKAKAKTQLDFTLARGVLITGKLVDEQGKPWPIGTSYAYAYHSGDEWPERTQFELNEGDYSLTDFSNKYRPKGVEERFPGTFLRGKGDYDCDQAVFPTRTTFIIQGVMPGDHTMIGMSTNKERQKVVKVLYEGRDIMKSGIDTKPGQEIKDVTIVVGPAKD